MNRRPNFARSGSFIAGDYSIADIARYPWIVPHKSCGQNLDDFPHLKRWFEAIRARPARLRTYEGEKETYGPKDGKISDEERKVLFGQTAGANKA